MNTDIHRLLKYINDLIYIRRLECELLIYDPIR